jgi:hypothetical protein
MLNNTFNSVALDLLVRTAKNLPSGSVLRRANFCSASPTWWLVSTRPCEETTLDPPLLNRTEEGRCSIHSGVA